MNFEYKHLLEQDFAPESRIWIYQGSRRFTSPEAKQVQLMLDAFVKNWVSHGVPVKGAGYLLFSQFIVLMADEEATGVSGCSTDSSVRLIKEIENTLSVKLFDRTTLAFIVNGSIDLIPLSLLQDQVDSGIIKPGTLYFNNLVQNKEELENKWIVPVGSSWLKNKISLRGSVT